MVVINLPLFNFVVQNFVQSNIVSIVLFNCWSIESMILTQYAFTQMSVVKFMYTQYVHLDRAGALENIEQRYFKHKHPTLGIFLDLNCKKSMEFLNMSSMARLFSEHYHWLIYDERANLTYFRKLFQNANLSVDTHLSYAIRDDEVMNSKSLSLKLYDVYNNGYHIGGKLNMTVDRAILCNESGCQLERYLSALHTRPKYQQRCYLPDVTWRISTLCTVCKLDAPEEQLKRHLLSVNNTEVDEIARFGYNMLLLLQEKLGFNMTQRYYDRWTNNDVFGGAVEEVALERVEMASTPFVISKGRLEYLTVIIETGLFRTICMFRTPRNTGIQGGVFLEPFDMTVWWFFAVVLIIAGVLLWKIFHIEHYRLRRFLDGYVPSLLSTILISFGSACAQGTHLIPKSTGGRIAFFSLSLITFIMYNYYTSMVVSSLLGSPMKSNIRTLSQLADSSLELGLDTLPYVYAYLNSSKLPEVRRLVQRKITSKRNPQNVWMTAEEGIKRVRDNPGFVFVFEAASGYALVERLYRPHEICDLNEILLRPDKNLHTQLHKNSSYKELVRLTQLRMLETGIIFKHQRQWVRSRLTCYASNYLLDVGLEYTAPLFFLLLCAYILVLVIMGLEYVFKRYADRRRQHRQEMLAVIE